MATDEVRIPFDDRVVVVTGAAGGIGRACARRFAAAGALLALCDRREADLDETAREIATVGHEPLAHTIDVREPDAVDAFLGEIDATHGRVDVLVNNAGGTFFASFSDLSAKGEAVLVAENFTQVTHLIRS
ncbi:MAG: SDR family NAD(P)-dependent oxidoreductase, partial [Proteobacteria bacterium]|nr:SDR family NAD(P)-dependent oxidoreductase [Pseudomonadota bacterium]